MNEYNVLFSSNYSPDFGLEGKNIVGIYDDETEAIKSKTNYLINRWHALVNTDKTNWKYGDEYMYSLPKLLKIGYNPESMSVIEIQNLINLIENSQDFKNYNFATLRKVFGTGKNYLVSSTYLEHNSESYEYRGKIGNDIDGVYETILEAEENCKKYNESEYRSILFNTPFENFIQYWGMRYPMETKEFWDEVKQELNVSVENLMSKEFTGKLLNHLDKKLNSEHVPLFVVLDVKKVTDANNR